jgi:hypothetical protein
MFSGRDSIPSFSKSMCSNWMGNGRWQTSRDWWGFLMEIFTKPNHFFAASVKDWQWLHMAPIFEVILDIRKSPLVALNLEVENLKFSRVRVKRFWRL